MEIKFIRYILHLIATDPILCAQIDASTFTEEDFQGNSPHTRGVRNLQSLIIATKILVLKTSIKDISKPGEFQVLNSSSNVEIVGNPNKQTAII